VEKNLEDTWTAIGIMNHIFPDFALFLFVRPIDNLLYQVVAFSSVSGESECFNIY